MLIFLFSYFNFKLKYNEHSTFLLDDDYVDDKINKNILLVIYLLYLNTKYINFYHI